MYDILGWMTDDSPFTHQLPRFADECTPHLLKWFPELAPCGVQSSLESLDRWIKTDKTGTSQEGIKMWLTEMKMMFPELRDTYEVPRIPKGDHTIKNPIDELIELKGGDSSKVIVVKV